jgi:hypothetical protein
MAAEALGEHALAAAVATQQIGDLQRELTRMLEEDFIGSVEGGFATRRVGNRSTSGA